LSWTSSKAKPSRWRWSLVCS